MPTRNKYTKQNIEEAVELSTTWADVCRMFKIQPATGAQTHLAKKAKKLGVDTTHFLGKGSNKGKPAQNKKPIEVYLRNEARICSDKLKKRLIKEGIKKAECEIPECGLATWFGRDLPLELDHINGNHDDNSLDNLMILCPNCHSVKTREQARVTVEQNFMNERQQKHADIIASHMTPEEIVATNIAFNDVFAEALAKKRLHEALLDQVCKEALEKQ